MPIIAFVKECVAGEKRCAVLPANVKAYALMGAEVLVESGIGAHIHIDDEAYIEAGAKVLAERAELLAKADIVATLHKLAQQDLSALSSSTLVISHLDPFNDKATLETLKQSGLTAISMEMIPRISRCQKMDSLSSQASLAGYVMVSKAMNALPRVLPMMMTPSGTLKPARVFVIGAGVAGLQAIATAKRLGANVIAFDTRSVVAEQVQSLGAKFLDIDLGETGQTDQGYAQELTAEQMQIQQAAQAKCIAESDIVITTAQLFGRKPPVLIKADVVASMKPGSVIVDMAAENGGNVEGSVAGQTVSVNGVTIIGTGAWANEVPLDASQMYANNVQNLLSDMWDKEAQTLKIDIEDEIQSSAIITHQGELINKTIKALYEKEAQV
ncbi:NAD(P) transhydrogenase subunit alpha [Aestuariibacter salexigens]|uniref:NAD(P) transhydrogenase subunit alpha n=1 Tax=Aestuariibacter salexigens TaxID=226010 RepID=UPI00040A75DA|nr:NAD(P) transhydrogenase subunit alpha [Aestuariibacter salexigens]